MNIPAVDVPQQNKLNRGVYQIVDISAVDVPH